MKSFLLKKFIFLLFCVFSIPAVFSQPFRILVSNDDGIESDGILALVNALEGIGSITVVAPLKNFSGCGHALTIEGPIVVTNVKREGKFFGYGLNCTPASCVKVGIEAIMENKPDLVVTGINDGFNIGSVIWVSGTFGAAQEAALHGIPAIAFSLEKGKGMDFKLAGDFAKTLVETMKSTGFPQETIVNVNFPACSREMVRGIALAPLSSFQWKNIWTKRKNPWGETYFWGKIKRPPGIPTVGNDYWAINEKYISVTPIPLNFDISSGIKSMAKMKFSFEGKTMESYAEK